MVDEFGPDLSVIGKYNSDPQANNIVTGRYPFANDHPKPGKLYAALLGSPHAHANILSIDTSKAEALEGVKAVITHEDNPNWSDTLLCWGHEVAAVAAVDEQIAERALDLIEVEYQVLPFIIDAEEATRPGATLAGTFPDSNVSPNPNVRTRGDVDVGFAEADVIVEETVGWCRPHTQNTIEPPSGMAWWEGDDVYGYDQNQNAHSNNRGNASSLGIPINRSHFSCLGAGGGFGGGGQTREPTTCALLSKKAGLPVSIRRPRRLGTTSRRNHYSPKLTMKLGCKNDGTMTAFEARWWGDGGRNASSGGSNYWQTVESTWKCANFICEVRGVATNKGVGSGYRCLAHPEAGYTTDMVLQKMADTLGMNLLDFYRKVFITPDMENQDGEGPMSTHGLRPCLEKAAEVVGYEAKYHAAGARTLPDGRMHGVGIHAHNDRHGTTTGGRGCIINMTRGGDCFMVSGGTRMSGGPGAMAQIVAETIGLTYDQVNVGAWGNPAISMDGGSQAGSTHTTNAGSAAQVAAWNVREQLFEYAAGELEVNPEDLDAKEGVIFVKADPSQNITHAAVMGRLRLVNGYGASYGSIWRKPDGQYPIGTPTYHRTGTAAAYEVAVDTETGEVEVLDYCNITDAGRVIDRFSSDGQIQSGQAVHWGKAFLWDVQHDPGTGVLLSQNLIDDKMATSMDVPTEKNVLGENAILLETVNAIGPYGCNGMGEPAASANYAALITAINNALGTSINVRPVTPDVILQALGKV
jgi:xanthine dehydrogenase molybdenum-binding subunit